MPTNSGQFKVGLVPWNAGRGKFIDCGVCGEKKWFQNWQLKSPTKGKFCSKECCYKGRVLKGTFQKGHAIIGGAHSMPHTEETKKKISDNNWMSKNRGELNPFWKGGARTQRAQDMGRREYKQWRSAVFKRDNYTCQDCEKSGLYIHADHIVEWAKNVDLRYDVSNGKTLCYRCHYKKTFGKIDEDKALSWGVPKKYRSGGVF